LRVAISAEELNIQIRRLLKTIDADHKERVSRYAKLDDFQEGFHWGKEDDERKKPSVPITWMLEDTLVPKILSRPLKPSVIPEESSNFPWPPDEFGQPQMPAEWLAIRDTLQRALGERQQRTDNEIASELLSAALDYYWDKADIEDTLRDAVRMMVRYGTAYLHDGYDGERELFGRCPLYVEAVHPKRVKVVSPTGRIEDAQLVAVDVPMTVKQVKERWPETTEGLKIPKGDAEDFDAATESGDQDIDDMHRSVMVQCCYLADDSLATEVEEGLREIQIGQDPMTGEPITVAEPYKEEYQVPRFKGGWRKVYRVAGKILNPDEADQQIPSGNGKLPIHPVHCYKNPGKSVSQGIVDKVIHLNSLLDQHLSYTVDNARATSNNFLIVKKGAVDNPNTAFTNGTGRVIQLNEAEPGTFQLVQGLGLNEAHAGLVNLLQQQIDLVSGVIDLRGANNLPQDASGAFVREVEAMQNARLAGIRSNVESAVYSLCRNVIANVVHFDESESAYSLQGYGKPVEVSFSPSTLAFADYDFDSRWDLVIGGPDNEPTDPLLKNDMYFGLVEKLAQMPRHLADSMVDVLDLPKAELVRQMLNRHFDEMEQQQKAQAEAQAQQPDPITVAAQAEFEKLQQKADLSMREGIGKAVAGAMENIAKKLSDNGDIMSANQIIQQIPGAVWQAYHSGEIPPITLMQSLPDAPAMTAPGPVMTDAPGLPVEEPTWPPM
jgi:hypothetical protein